MREIVVVVRIRRPAPERRIYLITIRPVEHERRRCLRVYLLFNEATHYFKNVHVCVCVIEKYFTQAARFHVMTL